MAGHRSRSRWRSMGMKQNEEDQQRGQEQEQGLEQRQNHGQG